jgi:NAD(P)H-flavin reductase
LGGKDIILKGENMAIASAMSDTPKLNEIVEHRQLAPSLTLWKLYVPGIAKKVKPGQFVVLRSDDRGERIPLTVADFDREKGTITVIFQEVGASTKKLAKYGLGQTILDVVGPLGKKSHIEKFGTVVCVGGGVGVAPVYPIAKALHEAGNKIISIIGSRSKDMLILEDEMKAISDELLVTTDDGSYGHHGFVTDELKRLIAEGVKIDLVLAIGPVIMMRAVTEVTRPHNLKTIVSLNSIMIDGTGMCGGCRTTVGNETKFVCVDGPEIRRPPVNFTELMLRQQMYSREERRAVWDHACNIDAMVGRRARGGRGCRSRSRAETPELQRGRPGLHEGERPHGSGALPDLQEARLRRGLPGQREDPRLHQADQGRRLHGRHPHGKGDEQPPGGLRPRLPAGIAVREQVYSRQERGAGRGRPPRAVRGGLRACRGRREDTGDTGAHG